MVSHRRGVKPLRRALLGALLCWTTPVVARSLPTIITPTQSGAPHLAAIPHPAPAPKPLPTISTSTVSTAASNQPATTTPTISCHDAALAAEKVAGLPEGMLDAIGRVESGRYDPTTGQTWAWPWAVNAAGEGHSFSSFVEAAAYVRARQAAGVASIDVGCFQINLMHHPDAFASLEEAFDPAANAAYAARFLTDLRDRTGGWSTAIAWYHSANPGQGEPYRDMVLARWPGNTIGVGSAAGNLIASAGWRGNPAPMPNHAPTTMLAMAAMPAYGIRVWTPATAPQINTPGGAALIQMSPGGYTAAAARLPRIMTAAR